MVPTSHPRHSTRGTDCSGLLFDREHFVEGVRHGAARLRDVHKSNQALVLADESKMPAEQVATAERSLDTGPGQLVHGDFWDNNVYLREEQIVLVADLDFIGVRPRIDDLALTLYYTNSTFADDRVSREGGGAPWSPRLPVRLRPTRPLSDVEWLGLRLAPARTAVGFIAQMNDKDGDKAIRALARELVPHFRWVRTLVKDLEEWQ